MDERFLESIVHKRAPLLARLRGYSGHIVLGRRLRPFSLWHQELLTSIDSPFLTVWQERPAAIQIFKSLYLATEICQLRAFETPGEHRFARKWAVLRFYVRLKPRRRLLRLLIEAAKFRAYMSDYCSVPIPFPDKHMKPVQSPGSAYQVELYRRFHPDRDERAVWAKSPSEIAWANTASQEAHGADISIMTQARIDARAAAMRGGRKSASGNGNGKKRNA